MALYCTQCGKENKDTAKFCSKCGEALEHAGTKIISAPIVLDNRYEIKSTVKSGAMGCIYKAYDRRLKETVAVKKMLPSSNDPAEKKYAEDRFEAEARLLFTLHHNGLPKVSDFFTEKDPNTGETVHYLVMTFIEGKDLETIMEVEHGKKTLPVKEVISYAKQILTILGYLHSQSPPIIYRDLNPRNVMIKNNIVYLVDFGIARFFKSQQKGTAIGTPGYAPPEQYKGSADPRSDLFSLGVLMHYLLTGIDPESSTISMFQFERPGKLNNSVPEYIDELVMSLLEVIPENRPPSAAKVLEVLNAGKSKSISRFSTTTSILTSHNKSISAPLTPTPTPKSSLLWLIALLSVIPLAILYLFVALLNHFATAQHSSTGPAKIGISQTPLAEKSKSTPVAASPVKRSSSPAPLPADSNEDRKYSDIFRAIDDGNLQAVKDFVRKKSGILSTNKYIEVKIEGSESWQYNFNPLAYAAHKGDVPITEFLLNNRAVVNSKLNGGVVLNKSAIDILKDVTPLHLAANAGIAELLISKGADINAKDNFGETPLHEAANAGVAELLISKGADINAIDKSGLTPLHQAANSGVAELLISKGADINVKNNSGLTPLHSAASNGYRGAVELLISKGADINAIDKNGMTPLHSAANAGIAELLISKGADINAKDNSCHTPLHEAANVGVAELLISKGADINAIDINGMTPLHKAASNGVAELLISKGADINAKDNSGLTPLHSAASNGYRGAVELLISKGADINAKTDLGQTPLFYAKLFGSKDIVDLLESHGASK